MTTTNLHQYFKAEYDKNNIITSYPSVLPEEIDLWLNKAYAMLINTKLTGNNHRGIAFEGDIKRISDLQGLVKHASLSKGAKASFANNAIVFDISTINDYLFYVVAIVKLDGLTISDTMLISHDLSKRVTETGINKPWIPKPLINIADDSIIVYYDTVDNQDVTKATVDLTYIKKPNVIDISANPTQKFELQDNVAFELVSLAVTLALENIESDRMETKGKTIILQE